MRKSPPAWAFVLAIAIVAVSAITGNADTWWLTAIAALVITMGLLKIGKQERDS